MKVIGAGDLKNGVESCLSTILDFAHQSLQIQRKQQAECSEKCTELN